MILADYSLPGWNGMEGLTVLQQRGLDIPFILVTGTVGEETAVDCIKQGAADYVLKDRLARLPVAIARALRERVLRLERAAVLEALRKSARDYRTLFESASDAILIFDPDGETILEANQRACETYGFAREKLLGMSLKTLRKEAGKGDEPAREVLEKGAVRNLETTHYRSNGTEIEMLVSASVIEYRGQTAILSINRDITRRKQAEEERKKLVKELCDRVKEMTALHRVAEILRDGERTTAAILCEVASVLPAAWQHPEITAARAAFADLEFSTPNFRPTQWKLSKTFVTSGGRQGLVEVVYLEERPVAAEGPFLAEERSLIRSVAEMLRSHFEHRRAEEALAQRAAELARSNAELEQFAYVASHDLQEPLRMVASYTALLARRYKDRLDAKADRYISYAVEGATRMNALIDDLLAYSRVDRRGGQFGPTSSEKAVNCALANIQVAIRESGAVVTRDPLPTVVADHLQLTQVFQNLLGNAIKFHGPEPPRIRISAEQRDKQWVFSVQDNGIGISPDHRDRVFVMFQRLHARGRYPGTGMGLAICKKIIERHNGRIWVESEPGKGSTFCFSLPREAAALSKEECNELADAHPAH